MKGGAVGGGSLTIVCGGDQKEAARDLSRVAERFPW